MTNLFKNIGYIGAVAAAVTMLAVPKNYAATKVQTKTIVVPSEDPNQKLEKGNTLEKNDPLIPSDALPKLEQKNPSTPDDNTPVEDDSTTEKAPPAIQRDISKLPEAVRNVREKILQAAKQGDIEKLRPLLSVKDPQTTLSIGGLDGDPITLLKEASGDDEGYEILAILIEVLEAGYVKLDEGTDNEVYVWPYFFAWPLDKLTPSMRVELFRILTAGDVQDSTEFGGYIFYRVGIRPDGHWDFFVAGD